MDGPRFVFMSDFMQKMQYGPRKIAVTGHFGSGKTEFAVSLAFAFAASGGAERLALCDLDIENPYFRSREQGEALERAGFEVVGFYGDYNKGAAENTCERWYIAAKKA